MAVTWTKRGADNLSFEFDGQNDNEGISVNNQQSFNSSQQELDEIRESGDYRERMRYRSGDTANDRRLRERRGAVSFCVDSEGTHRFHSYCASQKGHDLTLALCSVTALILTMIGLALLFAYVFGAHAVDIITINEFFLTLYGASILAMLILLILASLGKLTKDGQYRDQRRTAFLRGGIVCLGTGGIMFYGVAGVSVGLEPKHCLDYWDIINPAVAVIFTCSEMALIIKYSTIRINKTLGVTIMSQFLIVLVIATNLCVWVKTVVIESQEELESESTLHELHSDTYRTLFVEQNDTGNTSNSDLCDRAKDLQHQIQPYTWPLLIEFCVVASTSLTAILERCGEGLEHHTDQGSPQIVRTPSLTSSDIDLTTADGENSAWSFSGLSRRLVTRQNSKVRYYNNQLGFLAGWAMVVLSLVIIIVYLYVIASSDTRDGLRMEVIVYGTNMSISSVCLVALPITMAQMAKLAFRDEELQKIKNTITDGQRKVEIVKKRSIQRVIDRQLLSGTNLAQMGFHIMSMIAAVEGEAHIIFANSLVSLVMACAQTVFINWYALQKRSTTEENLRTKPGRQGLEILRCGNLALWLTNTFLVKHPHAKRVHNQAFGRVTWAVVSNICQPLLILFHFHSVCCLAEVINHSYTDEYLGVTRPPKIAKRLLEISEVRREVRNMETPPPITVASETTIDQEPLNFDTNVNGMSLSHM